MEGKISYKRNNENMEYICYRGATQSYPAHTHANHYTFGLVSEGMVGIVRNGEKRVYRAGEPFCIPPDTLHAVEAVRDVAYSMICVCVPVNITPDQDGVGADGIRKLKKWILDMPENMVLIGDMARNIGVSPYHMIRQFKAVCGLTPHQFQIQCRVRKGQKLLEAGKSVTEAAYATGFCDQSHFDRCFYRIVRLTPSEYRRAAGT